MNLDNPVGGKSLEDFAKQQAAEKAQAVNTAPTQVTKEEPKQEPTSMAVPVEPEKVEEPKIEKPKVELPPKEEPQSWDHSDEPAAKVETPVYDFQRLGSALDLKDVKGEEDIIAAFKSREEQLKKLAESPLESVPDEFREIVNIAKTGDWKEYVASSLIDYSKYLPQDLYEDEFFADASKNPLYFTDGKYDESKAVEALQAIPVALRYSLGQQIQAAKMNQQYQRQQAILRQNQERHEKAEKSLLEATRDLGKTLPVGNYGINFEAKHSNEIKEGIRNSTLTKKHLGASWDDLVARGADMSKVTRTITMAEYGEKMISFQANKGKTLAKKEILDLTQNADIKSSGIAPRPENDGRPKEVSAAEKFRQHVQAQSKSVLG